MPFLPLAGRSSSVYIPAGNRKAHISLAAHLENGCNEIQ